MRKKYTKKVQIDAMGKFIMYYADELCDRWSSADEVWRWFIRFNGGKEGLSFKRFLLYLKEACEEINYEVTHDPLKGEFCYKFKDVNEYEWWDALDPSPITDYGDLPLD